MTKLDSGLRHDWQVEEIEALMDLPFNDVLYQAHTVYRQYFDTNSIQISTLLNIKTGGCPEDCGYCSQSAHHQSGLEKEKLMQKDEILAAAKNAKKNGASRFCMGAAWRSPQQRDMPGLCEIITEVNNLGLETCMTLGMLDQDKAKQLKAAGLDYYNHNLDTSPEYYDKVITTRAYQDRLDTLQVVRESGMKVCCGGILGLGENRRDRARLLQALANLAEHPESVPINMLIKVEGTPLENAAPVDSLEFIRVIAVARILMPKSMVRLSAGRLEMNDEMQALCFFAGANSIFYGERLLTADNPEPEHDHQLFSRLGLRTNH